MLNFNARVFSALISAYIVSPASSEHLCVEIPDDNCGDVGSVEDLHFVAMCPNVTEVSLSLIVLDICVAAMVGEAWYLNFVESCPLRLAHQPHEKAIGKTFDTRRPAPPRP
jgi:hypothetical protein